VASTSRTRQIAIAALALVVPAAADARRGAGPGRPAATITSGPTGTIARTSAAFTFQADGTTRFRCRLDGIRDPECASPKTYSWLTAGQHRFVVRAVDRAAKRRPITATEKAASTSAAKRRFKVEPPADATPPPSGDTTAPPSDTTPPETLITSGPSGTIDATDANFGFSSSESGSGFECRLDGKPWAGCSSPATYSALADGDHSFEVRATDAAGNTDPSPASQSFTVASSSPPSECGFGTFSRLKMPGACWRPYSDGSPFNRGIPGSPAVASNSAAIVGRVNGFGAPQNITVGGGEDWGHPIFYSQPDDPVFTIHCAKPWGACELEGMQVRIPDAARPASGGDAHMAVIDQAGGWEYDFWQVQNKPPGGGTITISWGGRTRIGSPDADGLGSNATAAHFGLAAGPIRAAELEAGRIDHALFMVVRCTNGSYVWPAEGVSGTPCSSIGLSNADAPALGQHFYLAMSDAEIAATGAPVWKQTILRAMAHYGMFVGDTGGSSWGVQFESGASFTSFGSPDPFVRLGDLWGVPKYPDPNVGPQRVFKLAGGVDYGRLRALDPCVARGTC
jgi:hypothetical protein